MWNSVTLSTLFFFIFLWYLHTLDETLKLLQFWLYRFFRYLSNYVNKRLEEWERKWKLIVGLRAQVFNSTKNVFSSFHNNRTRHRHQWKRECEGRRKKVSQKIDFYCLERALSSKKKVRDEVKWQFDVFSSNFSLSIHSTYTTIHNFKISSSTTFSPSVVLYVIQSLQNHHNQDLFRRFNDQLEFFRLFSSSSHCQDDISRHAMGDSIKWMCHIHRTIDYGHIINSHQQTQVGGLQNLIFFIK